MHENGLQRARSFDSGDVIIIGSLLDPHGISCYQILHRLSRLADLSTIFFREYASLLSVSFSLYPYLPLSLSFFLSNARSRAYVAMDVRETILDFSLILSSPVSCFRSSVRNDTRILLKTISASG